MRKLISSAVIATALALTVIVATPASAATGLCGYFSESQIGRAHV